MTDKALAAFKRIAAMVNAEVKEARISLEGPEAVIGYPHKHFDLKLDALSAAARFRGISVMSMEHGALLYLDGVAVREIKGGLLAKTLA